MNFLESLVAEWYQYNGYFVLGNIRTQKREQGGYDKELDLLCYSPREKKIIHIETSNDANSWKDRKISFEKKFALNDNDYESCIGTKVDSIEKIAVIGTLYSTKNNLACGNNITVKLLSQLINEITTKLKNTNPSNHAVPENFPLLRAIQLVLHFQKEAP